MSAVEKLEKLLASGRDSAMLRYGLGDAYLKAGNPAAAAEHLRQAVDQDPNYSAAWKLLGKTLAEGGSAADAVEAYRQGIRVAEGQGDLQAAKEMRVFLKRLEKSNK